MALNNLVIPLNVNPSLKLITMANKSPHLTNISHSLNKQLNCILRLEELSTEIGEYDYNDEKKSANEILEEGLQSEEYNQQTMVEIRSLIFNHIQTHESASSEEDYLTAYSSCVASNRLLNRTGFEIQLFSHCSLEELKFASDGLNRCKEIMNKIWSKLDEKEKSMITLLTDSIDEVEKLTKIVPDAENTFLNQGWRFLDESEEWITEGIWKVDEEFVFRTHDRTVEDWVLADDDHHNAYRSLFGVDVSKILHTMRPRSNNRLGGMVPQEFLDKSEKPLSSGKGFFRRGKWGMHDRERFILFSRLISEFEDCYNAWVDANKTVNSRTKEILKICNNSFEGRMEIQT